MAYVLGFWFADGYMRHEQSYRIFFSSSDLRHLQKIRKALGSTNRIVQYTRRGILEGCFYLEIYSKKLFFDLLALGASRNNSRNMNFPRTPKTYLPDFIRGFFDGDGSVHYVRYKSSKNSKIYKEIRSNFTSGSLAFLQQLRDQLTERLGLCCRKVCQYGRYQFKLGYGQKDTRKLLCYMYYPGHKLSLRRKAEFLKKFNNPVYPASQPPST